MVGYKAMPVFQGRGMNHWIVLISLLGFWSRGKDICLSMNAGAAVIE
jgi:hypothetical protein